MCISRCSSSKNVEGEGSGEMAFFLPVMGSDMSPRTFLEHMGTDLWSLVHFGVKYANRTT